LSLILLLFKIFLNTNLFIAFHNILFISFLIHKIRPRLSGLPSYLLKGEIVTPNHYPPLGGKTKGQGWPFIISHTELPSLFYFTTNIQVISKRSYKWKWGK
jgi:hypothetical protein